MKLYKYRGPQWVSLFDDWRVRFTPPIAFNDPFEMKPRIDGIASEELLHERANAAFDKGVNRDYDQAPQAFRLQVSRAEFIRRAEPKRAEIVRRIREQGEAKALPEAIQRAEAMINASIGIFTVGAVKDDLLMWAHYGDSHRGFALELDSEAPFFNQQEPPASARASEEDRKKFPSEYGFLREVDYATERPGVLLIQEDISVGFKTWLVKSDHWKYEREYRILMPLEYATVLTKASDGSKVHLFDLPPATVTKVIFGCTSSAALEKAVREKLSARKETSHIAFERAFLDEREYKLNFK